MGGDEGRSLVIGFGVTAQAVVDGLRRRGGEVIVADDRPTPAGRAAADAAGVELIEAPDGAWYDEAVTGVDEVLPSPGVGDRHPAIEAAARLGVPVRSEFDLAARWDHRPLLAVTGTDGKTTVTTLTTAMLEAAGLKAMAVGNTEVPLVAAIDDPAVDVFVVEASSFRLDHSERFAPRVGTWLNIASDHLDLHHSAGAYEAAKAKLWAHQSASEVAIGNADDPVVSDHLAKAAGRHVTFGLGPVADYRLDGQRLVTPAGDVLVLLDELWRSFPHDIANALAASATAIEGGGSVEGCGDALRRFRGLPHRITLVGEGDGVRYYDDSKATTPNAALAAIRSFPSVVLIAGGQNKGLDLSPLAGEASRIRAVVALGEAAGDVARAFAGVRPVDEVATMDEAVRRAAAAARPGDAVLLSPACASFDQYRSYAERGDDFARHVKDLIGAAP